LALCVGDRPGEPVQLRHYRAIRGFQREINASGGAAGVHFSTQSGLRHARRRQRRIKLRKIQAWLSIRRQDVRRR
jgi:hypothetical protein